MDAGRNEATASQAAQETAEFQRLRSNPDCGDVIAPPSLVEKTIPSGLEDRSSRTIERAHGSSFFGTRNDG